MTSSRRGRSVAAIGLWTVVLWLAVGSARVAWAQEPAPSDSPGAVDADRIAALVRQLGSADYEERVAADSALRLIGMDAIDQLARYYRTTDDFEVRIRIERIVEYVFFWDRVLGNNGFLGIQHQVYVPPPQGDPRIEAGKAAFRIAQVIPGTAADESGLKAGDIVVAIDGVRLPAQSGPSDFADLIRVKKPGSELKVEFWRGGQHIEKVIRIKARPKQHYGPAAPEELNNQMNSAITEFPKWWLQHFGTEPHLDASVDRTTPERPLFLKLPSDHERR